MTCTLQISCQEQPGVPRGRGETPKDSDHKYPPSILPSEKNRETVEQEVIADLVKAGWDWDAATAVTRLNSEWFQLLKKQASSELASQVSLLRRLGQFPNLFPMVSERPEIAGLLAAADNPEIIANTLAMGIDYDVICNLYVMNAGPRDSARLADALKGNLALITSLYKRGFVRCEVVFDFPRGGESGKEYERWLNEALTFTSGRSDREVGSLMLFIAAQGPEIRRRLTDNEFQRKFLSQTWPKLQRVATQEGSYDRYVWDVRLWDVLLLPEGERLLQMWGVMPGDLLFGPNAYPANLRNTVIQALLQNNQTTIAALDKFRDDQTFQHLMRRGLPPECLAKALNTLFRSGPNFTFHLNTWARLSDSAVCEDLSPPEGLVTYLPLYYCYYVPKKLAQGRDVSGTDIFFVAFDVGTLFLPPLRAGGAIERGGAGVFKTTLRNEVRQEIVGKLGKETARKLEREIAPEMFSLGLSKLQSTTMDYLAKKTTFEITGPVRFLFRNTPMGGQTLRRLGMDARLFMRGDARVFLVPAKLASGPAARFLIDTAKSLGVGAAAETEKGKQVLDSVVRTATDAKETLYTWKKHVSAWFLMNGTGMLDSSHPPMETDRISQPTLLKIGLSVGRTR